MYDQKKIDLCNEYEDSNNIYYFEQYFGIFFCNIKYGEGNI